MNGLKSKKILLENISWIDRMRLNMLKIDYSFSESERAIGDKTCRDIDINEADYSRAKLIMSKEI